MTIRKISQDDFYLLREFTWESCFLPPGEEPFERDILELPHVSCYYKDFGKQAGDHGVVAEVNGKVVGIAWTRIMPVLNVFNNDTTVLSNAVLAEYRNKGIGAAMLAALFELLREEGYKETGLNVHIQNPAINLYKRAGYELAGEESFEGEVFALLMLKKL